MKQAVLSKGVVVPRDVPIPIVDEKGVLVRVECSCISSGTEMASVRNLQKSLFKRALESPKLAKAGIDILKDRGLGALTNTIRRETGAAFGKQTGYSAAGTVVEVGVDAGEIHVGQRVAVAGAEYANHAGYVFVPRNLVMPIPEGLGFDEASTVALGGIAMQGVRVLSPVAGEKIAVMGMGLIGQLAAQILTVAGCSVIGIDISAERLALARDHFRIQVIDSTISDPVKSCMMLTNGEGVDGAIFAAATSSSEPLSSCFKMLRKRGRLVLVGVSGMTVDRADIYAKELEFRMACSYGPGRYDPSYEEAGIDYPYDYVRWTEKRNMELYLSLLEQRKIDVRPMISEVRPVEECDKAYLSLSKPSAPLIALLTYADSRANAKEADEDLIRLRGAPGSSKRESSIKYAVIGAGSFARAMHVPNLAKHPGKFYLKAVMSRTGYSAAALAAQFKAEYATTNLQRILEDEDIEMVLICTRHNLHASYAIQALKAGKHVFVEKPPALDERELSELMRTIKETRKGYLVGYNRRFSDHATEIRDKVKGRRGKMLVEYTMNAGFIERSHWVHGPEGGGRIIGEGCHIVDLLGFIVGHRAKDVSTNHLCPTYGYFTPSDNVTATITYEDGSLAVMNYIANGSTRYPKETMRVSFDGKAITMDNYMSLTAEGISVKRIRSRAPEKGQMAEMLRYYDDLRTGENYPIPLEEIEQTSRITFRIADAAKNTYLDRFTDRVR